MLDEGHQIRNPKTKAAEACRGLTADRRWVVTGTPIINSPKDLGSILQFLRVCAPLDQEDYFKSLLLRPLTAGSAAGAELLKGVMGQICLRRTKEVRAAFGAGFWALTVGCRCRTRTASTSSTCRRSR